MALCCNKDHKPLAFNPIVIMADNFNAEAYRAAERRIYQISNGVKSGKVCLCPQLPSSYYSILLSNYFFLSSSFLVAKSILFWLLELEEWLIGLRFWLSTFMKLI